MKRGIDAEPLGERVAVRAQPLAHLRRRREGMLGRDVVAVGAQPAEVGRARGDQPRPPVGEVRRDLDPDLGHQPPRLAHEPLHVVHRHRRRPGRRRDVRALVETRAPVALRGLRRDLRGLLAVVAAVRDEVLEDDLLQVREAGERLERGHPVVLALPDPDEDAARERDPQRLRVAERLQAQRRRLGRRGLVRDEVVAQRLDHQPLARGHLAQARQVGAPQRAEVRVREDAPLQRAFAAPHDVGDEVLEPERRQPLAHAGVMARVVAREDQQLLDVAARRAVQQGLHLVGRVKMRLVRRERAVLAVRDAGPRKRQRDVAREGDPPAHPSRRLHTRRF